MGDINRRITENFERTRAPAKNRVLSEADIRNCEQAIQVIKKKNRERLLILLLALGGSLTIGSVGYGLLGKLTPSQAFYNASMILSGMGPVDDLSNKIGAKIFASFFAIFSGAFFLIIFAFLVQSIFLSTIEARRLEEICPDYHK